MVSICTKSPGESGTGRSTCGWYLLYGLRFFNNPLRSSVRLTDERDTFTSWFFNSWCMTSAHRLVFILWWNIFHTNSLLNSFGWCFGRDDCVGMGWYPYFCAFFTHLHMVLEPTPNRRPTSVGVNPRLTISAASWRTLGMCGFVVYAISLA